MRLSQLTNVSGTTGRRPFLFWGALLFFIKYNLDRLIAAAFMRDWYLPDYFLYTDELPALSSEPDALKFYATLIAVSLPFVAAGTSLCLQRLRDAGLPTWLVVVFFVPFINLVFFALLAALPPVSPSNDGLDDPMLPRRRAWLPQSKMGAVVAAIAVVTAGALLLMGLFVNVLGQYGWGVFVGIPFCLGFATVSLYGRGRQLSKREAMGAATTAVIVLELSIFALAVEGIICLLMAAPILLLLAWLGALLAYFTLRNTPPRMVLRVSLAPTLMMMLLGLVEWWTPSVPPQASVVTEIVVDAPANLVWDQLAAFSTIEAPKHWIFRTGIAYPTHAELVGTGVGAVRHCHFSTGAFVEPITVWEPPYRLAFSVQDQPPPMIERSPYPDLDIPHLDGYFRSERGEFLLTTLPDGRTRLRGTTWYRHELWPSFYWRAWSDWILHRVHYRVLEHIRVAAEGERAG